MVRLHVDVILSLIGTRANLQVEVRQSLIGMNQGSTSCQSLTLLIIWKVEGDFMLIRRRTRLHVDETHSLIGTRVRLQVEDASVRN